ncbi:MAG TPA: YfaZ family outer membrane protein [Steroidobacteraceae bacterium]|nr:YfaZ family outer membrane protein [Steroidobacteraceae bacterium]
MKYCLTLTLLLLIAGGALHAQEPLPAGVNTAVEAMGGNSALQLRYLAPSPWAVAGARSDLDYGFLFSQDRDIIGTAALMFHTDLNVIPGLTINIGPQGYLAALNALNKTDVFAVAFGADARYPLPFLTRWGIAAFGSAFYSPGVLTFGNAQNVYDFTAGGEVRFTSRLAGRAGYRWLKFTLVGEPDDRVQNELFVGLRWQLR